MNNCLTILKEADPSSFSGDMHRKLLAVAHYALLIVKPTPAKVALYIRKRVPIITATATRVTT